MLNTTVGQALVNYYLPNDLKDYTRSLDGKSIKKFLKEVYKKYPSKFSEILFNLGRVAHQVAYLSGGLSPNIRDNLVHPKWEELRRNLYHQIAKYHKDNTLTAEEKENKIVELYDKYVSECNKLVEELYPNNVYLQQVKSGTRGSIDNVRSLVFGDIAVVDHRNKPVLYPILHSYYEGLSPMEHFVNTFAARKSLFDTKLAVQNAGFFSKQLIQAAHRLVTTKKDYDKPPEVPIGMPADVDDPDNEGALLAAPAGDYPRNTIITPKVLSDLKARGIKRILVRSPITAGPPEGGLYSYDVGVRERGTIAPVGDFVGISAAQAVSEPITQGQISSKHVAGLKNVLKVTTGFKTINQLVQVPEIYPGGAAHAKVDGKVHKIEPAPQGGTYVYVNNEIHYVPANVELKVKVGDVVEAGDVLSGGLPNPAEIVKHKGIGEGRRYFTQIFKQVLTDNNIQAHRRNVELVARGLIDHVVINDIYGNYLPDDIVPYNIIERTYKPREDSEIVPLDRAVGKYLEKPVLHYTIGTQIKPSMIQNLKEFGVKNILVNKAPPPFSPKMIRGLENVSHDPDWMTKFLGSYLQRGLLKSVHRGAVSDETGTSYIPALASGHLFGRAGQTVSWKPEEEKDKSPVQKPVSSEIPIDPLLKIKTGSILKDLV